MYFASSNFINRGTVFCSLTLFEIEKAGLRWYIVESVHFYSRGLILVYIPISYTGSLYHIAFWEMSTNFMFTAADDQKIGWLQLIIKRMKHRAQFEPFSKYSALACWQWAKKWFLHYGKTWIGWQVNFHFFDFRCHVSGVWSGLCYTPSTYSK